MAGKGKKPKKLPPELDRGKSKKWLNLGKVKGLRKKVRKELEFESESEEEIETFEEEEEFEE
ncbi:MAG: hypothetical protein ACETWM_02060 [Candidatus Lokiarchaeia archaeon]